MSNIETHQVCSLTDIGKKRKNNEDTVYVNRTEQGYLIAAADGMGGARKGDLASQMAVHAVAQAFSENSKVFNKRNAFHLFEKALSKCNEEIYADATSSLEYKDMGTTFCGAIIGKNETYAVSIGDSRVYTYSRTHGLKQISVDQSYVQFLFDEGKITYEQMQNHPQKNIIINAVGIQEKLEKIEEYTLPNDSFDYIFCVTDGLHGMVSDEEMTLIFSDHKEVKEIARCLVDKALDNGGLDNIAIAILAK